MMSRPAVTAGLLPLSPADDTAYRTAFAAADVRAWPRAFQAAAQAENKAPAKVLTWLFLADPNGGASFSEVASFLATNPHWPLADTLRRNAEDALAAEPVGPRTNQLALEWFARHAPRSGAGMVRYAQALDASGRAAEASAWAKRAWTTAPLPKAAESILTATWGKQITQADHEARLDSLLWLGRPNEARRLVARIPVQRRAVAEARIALATQAPGVDAAVAKVPGEQAKEPGLVYERVRWRRRNGNIHGAIDLLAATPAQSAHQDPWWDERVVLARRALEVGRISDAYRIAAQHGQTDRADIAEAEWMAGWIALRFLGEPKLAYDHFLKQHAQVRLPVSIARAAYWAGRVAEALGERLVADGWFEQAARYGITYYGQLAAERIATHPTLALPSEPQPTAEEVQAFFARELVQVVLFLAAVGEERRLRPFLIRMSEDAATPADRALLAELAARTGRTDLAVATAKLAAHEGVLIGSMAYPLLTPSTAGVEQALVLALIRQESEFFPNARSSAGALGLMQLMPATARRVATAQKVDYEPSLLTLDPAYNLQLGTAHLADLLDTFRGSYVLALAAYNAGEGRARQWIKQYGDPRDAQVDIVDWIEQIPIEETRNYVQRVMENLTVYRHRLASEATPVTLMKDLRR
jgi:soluble lytic murein transglycosylase